MTLSGNVSAQDNDRIMFFDSLPVSKGWRILSFNGNGFYSVSFATLGVLHTDGDYNPTTFDPEDNRVIGVVQTNTDGNQNNLLKANHVTVSDLYIKNVLATGSFNYLIELEEINITAEENIIYMIKERSQNIDSQ